MTSPTDKHVKRSEAKHRASGRWRKNRTANLGSTKPSLALDKPNANEKAQKDAQKKAKAQA